MRGRRAFFLCISTFTCILLYMYSRSPAGFEADVRKQLTIHANSETAFSLEKQERFVVSLSPAWQNNDLDFEDTLDVLPTSSFIGGISANSGRYVDDVCLAENFTSQCFLKEFDFTDVDGGSWKQGWPVTYDRSNLKQLEVFVVPHSHVDVGWVNTLDDYYSTKVKHILDNVVYLLQTNYQRRFIWSETVFLSMWWADSKTSEQQKLLMRGHIQEGRLEICSGGWVVPDEASTNYEAVVDQLVLGVQWLKTNLDIDPESLRSTLPLDIFGAGQTVPEIMRQANYTNLVIQRVHYILKKNLARRKQLEMLWNCNIGHGGILTHIQPFYSYDVSHTCGPDPAVCCQFDFERLILNIRCPWPPQPEAITDANVELRSQMLVDQYRKKASLYQYPVLLVFVGDDFRYKNPTSAEFQFVNYERLFNYINRRNDWKMKVQFGTLANYFAALRKQIKISGKQSINTFTGDLYPYADKAEEYWTGYFTSRPHLKSIGVEMQSMLRSAEILSMLADVKSTTRTQWSDASLLTKAREENAIFQHHDSITGTSPSRIIADLMKRIRSFRKTITQSLENSLKRIIYMDDISLCHMCPLDSDGHDGCSRTISVDFTGKTKKRVIVFNSLGSEQTQLVRMLAIPSGYSADVRIVRENREFKKNVNKDLIEHQMTLLRTGQVELSFLATVGPMSMQSYLVSIVESTKPRIYIQRDAKEQSRDHNAHLTLDTNDKLTISNGHIELVFYNGQLSKSIYYQLDVGLKINMVEYDTSRGGQNVGAYLSWIPPEQTLVDFSKAKTEYIIKGPLYESIDIRTEKYSFTITLYKVNKAIGKVIDVFVTTNLTKSDSEDVALMITPPNNIQGDAKVYIDSNGMSMIERQYNRHLPPQANIYPMTRGVVIDCQNTDVSILSAQPRGVMIHEGHVISVMLDRRSMQDDNRGMAEALKDPNPASHHFKISFNKVKPASEGIWTQEIREVSDQLLYPFLYATSDDAETSFEMDVGEYCSDLHILSTSQLSSGQYLIVMENRGLSHSPYLTVKIPDIFPSILPSSCKRIALTTLTGTQMIESWRDCTSAITIPRNEFRTVLVELG